MMGSVVVIRGKRGLIWFHGFVFDLSICVPCCHMIYGLDL